MPADEVDDDDEDETGRPVVSSRMDWAARCASVMDRPSGRELYPVCVCCCMLGFALVGDAVADRWVCSLEGDQGATVDWAQEGYCCC